MEFRNETQTQLVMKNTPFPDTFVIVSAATSLAILFSLVVFYSDKIIFGTCIKDGRKIEELPSDARVAKFVQSLQLSDQGKTLAGDEPYLIHNGRSRELVITQPDHLRDFYKDDTKHK
ncbi:hypothetical protein VTN77DRAFT_9275 [Rasamsonia byssochlamydoides]|uniref:uncharacterized protein n=1 Tax=Rasamsonia byssochlamydoides TaxID=89139 RepID=UPI003743C07D